MDFLPLIAAIAAGVVCLGSILQGIVAGIELIKGLSRKRWSAIMLISIILATSSGYVAYVAYVSSSKSDTSSSTITSTLSSSPNCTPTASPAGNILYKADWSKGSDGWNAVNEWNTTTSGILANNGTATGNGILLAPFQSTSANYAVDACIQILRSTGYDGYGFGIIVGSDGGIDGYTCYIGVGGPDSGSARIKDVSSDFNKPSLLYGVTPLKSYIYSVDTNWYNYRVEVRGAQITFLINNQQILQISSSDYIPLRGTYLGLIDSYSAINVSNFQVTSL